MNKPSSEQIQATHLTATATAAAATAAAAAAGRSARIIGRPDDVAVEDAAQDAPIEDIAATAQEAEQEAETLLAMADETGTPAAAEPPSTPTPAPSSSAGHQDIKPLWLYGGAGGLGLLAVAAASSGSQSAPAPAPAPAPADTTPPTAPTGSTVTVNAVKASVGTGSHVSVHLSSVPADAATITLTLIDSSNPAHTYTHQLTGTGTGSGAATTQSYTFANVPDGAYTTTVAYTDAAGNPATFTTPTPQALDTVVGNPTVSAPPSYNPTTQASSLNVTLPTDAKAGDTLSITVHDVSGALADRLVTHALTAQDVSAGIAHMDLSPVLVNGTSYTASTTLTDAALNVSTPASTAPFTVDTVTTVPTLLQAGSANAISGNTVFSSAIDITGVETGASVQYEVYQGQPTGVLTTLTTAAATGTTYTIPSQTSNGSYSIHVVVTDAAGNTASSITSYTLQGINGPLISFTDTAPAGTAAGDALWTDHLTQVLPVLTLTPDAAMPSSFSVTEYSTNGGQTWLTSPPSTLTWTPNTRVDVSVRYTDPSSGLSTLPSNTFATYDPQAPSAAPTDLGLTSTKVGNNQSDIVVSLSNIPADALANLTQVELLSNGQPVANLTATITPGTTTSTYTFSSPSLSDATYSARVSYTDAAGNTTSTPVVSSTSINPGHHRASRGPGVATGQPSRPWGGHP